MRRLDSIIMIEWLAPEQNWETEQLYMEVFDDEPEEIREIYPWLVRNNRIVVKKDAGAIVAMVQIVPRSCRLFGSKLILPYMFAVSTKKEYRGMGLMRELLERSLVKLASERVPMVHLVPAVEHVYEKFGFMFIADGPKEELQICNPERAVSVSHLNFESPNSDTSCAILAKKTSDWQDRHFSLAKIEKSSYYKDMDRIYRSYGGGISVLMEQGEMVGYRIVSRDGERILCEKQVRYDEQEPAALREDFSTQENLQPFVMGRLVDIPAFLAYFKPKKSFSVVLKLSDPVLSQNNGYFRFGAADGRFYWKKQMPDKGRHGLIILDIGTFTALLCGYQNVLWLPKEDCLRGIYLWDVF